MRIELWDGEKARTVTLPTGWLFSSAVIRFGLKRFATLGDISPEAARRMSREIKRIRQEKGGWELVEVYCADGRTVRIRL